MRSAASSLTAAIDNFERAHVYVLKPLTMRCYLGSLRRFADFVGKKPTVADLNSENVDRYIASVMDHRYMARNDCAVLKVFSRWCGKAGYLPSDVLLSVTAPKVPKWRPKPLPKDDVAHVLEAAASHAVLGIRDKAIITLSLDTGARPNEIRQLRYPEDVDLDKGLIRIREETSKTVQGHRTIGISPQTASVVREYVERDRPDKEGPLFLNAHGDAFKYGGFLAVHHRLRDKLKAEGTKGYQAYRLRHTGITNKAKVMPTLVVQRLAGHKSPITTMNYYGGMSDDELMRLPDAMTMAYGRL